METKSDYSVCSLAYALTNEVVVQILDGAVLRVKLYDFLVRLTFTLVNLRLVQWMSIKDVACVILCVRNPTPMCTCILRNRMVGYLIDNSVLNLRCLHHESFVLNFLLVGYITIDSLNPWHVLRSVKFVLVNQVHLAR